MIKTIKELFWYLRYRKIVKILEQDSMYSKYNFSSGWLKQFGTIIKIPKSCIVDQNFTQQNPFGINEERYAETSYIVSYMSPFFTTMENLGLSSDTILYKLERRFGEIENSLSNDFIFYNIVFSFNFQTIKLKMITRVVIILSIILILLYNKDQILNLF